MAGTRPFAKDGASLAQLRVKIAGTNQVAGTDYDRLVGGKSVSDLNNAELNIGIGTSLESDDFTGQEFTILICTNDLSGQAFSAVAWDEWGTTGGKWGGDIEYGFDGTNGYVKLKNLFTFLPATVILVQ